MFTSGTSGYHPNPWEVACAKTFHGPWKDLGNPHTEDPSCTSFNSQITSVFKHPFKKDLYIALADRWLPKLPEMIGEDFYNGNRYRTVEERFKLLFGPDRNLVISGESQNDSDSERQEYGLGLDVDTSIADYVWLPIRFDGEMAYIDWKDEWKVEEYE